MLQTTSLSIFNQLNAHDCPLSHVVFSQKGEFLVTADVEHNVVVWKAGKVHYRLNFRSLLERLWGIDRVRSIAIDDMRNMLYVAAGGRLHALDLETGVRRWIYAPPYAFCFLITSPVSMMIRDDGNLVAAFDDGAMEIWTPDGKRLFRFHDNDVPTKLIQLHRDDAIIGTDGFSVTIWDPQTQAKVGKLHTGERIFGFAGSASDGLCATRTFDSVTIWALDTGSPIARIPVGIGLPCMAFTGLRKLLAVSEEHRIRLYDYTGNPIAQCELGDRRTICISASEDGTALAVGCDDGTAKLFDLTKLS
ncbi:MAG: hypothetical protein KF784_11135 [Fimbriimonadaceae bacterium]|nr:hypothetical protein [Fimbriimonadaceae bacterium]